MRPSGRKALLTQEGVTGIAVEPSSPLESGEFWPVSVHTRVLARAATALATTFGIVARKLRKGHKRW